jgi:lipid-binding SYLF domain-containing protein
MSNSVKLGADLSVAVGPVGAGAQAATTTNIGADIYQYGYSQGVYGGINVEGSVISSDDEWNQAYYQSKTVEPAQIVLKQQFHNAGAETLRKELPTKG